MKFEYLLLYLNYNEIDYEEDEELLEQIATLLPSRRRYENIREKGFNTYFSHIDNEKNFDFFFDKETNIQLKNFDGLLMQKCNLFLVSEKFSTSEIHTFQTIRNYLVTANVWDEFFGGWDINFLMATTQDSIYSQFPGVSYDEDSYLLNNTYSYIPFDEGHEKHYNRLHGLISTMIHPIFRYQEEYWSNPEYQFFEFQLTGNPEELPLLMLQEDIKNLKYLRFLKETKEAGPVPRRTVSYAEFLFGNEMASKLTEDDISILRDEDLGISKLHKKLEKELSDPDRDVEMFSIDFLFDIDKDQTLPWLDDSND